MCAGEWDGTSFVGIYRYEHVRRNVSDIVVNMSTGPWPWPWPSRVPDVTANENLVAPSDVMYVGTKTLLASYLNGPVDARKRKVLYDPRDPMENIKHQSILSWKIVVERPGASRRAI